MIDGLEALDVAVGRDLQSVMVFSSCPSSFPHTTPLSPQPGSAEAGASVDLVVALLLRRLAVRKLPIIEG
jgi:hypothetical protein